MKKTWKGSYTVEASIVVTVTILVLGALIILTFYVHDRAVSQALMCEAAAIGSNTATVEKRTKAVEEAKKQITASRFLGSRDVESSVSAGKKKVSASFDARYPVPGFAAQYFSGGELSIDTAWDCDVYDPAGAIRLIRFGKAMIGSVKGLITGGDD